MHTITYLERLLIQQQRNNGVYFSVTL